MYEETIFYDRFLKNHKGKIFQINMNAPSSCSEDSRLLTTGPLHI